MEIFKYKVEMHEGVKGPKGSTHYFPPYNPPPTHPISPSLSGPKHHLIHRILFCSILGNERPCRKRENSERVKEAEGPCRRRKYIENSKGL